MQIDVRVSVCVWLYICVCVRVCVHTFIHNIHKEMYNILQVHVESMDLTLMNRPTKCMRPPWLHNTCLTKCTSSHGYAILVSHCTVLL